MYTVEPLIQTPLGPYKYNIVSWLAFQGVKYLYKVGIWSSVLIRKVSSFQGCRSTVSLPHSTASLPDSTALLPDSTASPQAKLHSLAPRLHSLPLRTPQPHSQASTVSLPDSTASFPGRAPPQHVSLSTMSWKSFVSKTHCYNLKLTHQLNSDQSSLDFEVLFADKGLASTVTIKLQKLWWRPGNEACMYPQLGRNTVHISSNTLCTTSAGINIIQLASVEFSVLVLLFLSVILSLFIAPSCHKPPSVIRTTGLPDHSAGGSGGKVQYNILTRCKFTQKPRVANCVRVRTCTCSAGLALVTRGWCTKPEVDSLKFDRREQRCLPKEVSQ